LALLGRLAPLLQFRFAPVQHRPTIERPARYRERLLHAVLFESPKQTRELLNRLELRGVQVTRAEQREVVRLSYVATRNQVKALEATLELEGLEWWGPSGPLMLGPPALSSPRIFGVKEFCH
jgi:hypothetical protein